MGSPFPGMDPYLEQPLFWASFHSRLIIGLANAIEADLSADYYVEVETRTYLDGGSDRDDGSIIGISDAALLARGAANVSNPAPAEPASNETASNLAVQIRPQLVEVPLPEEIQERYLEVREVETNRVITTLEVLSPKNKKAGEGKTAYLKKRLATLGSKTHLIEIDLLRAGRPMPLQGSWIRTAYRVLVSRSFQRPQAELYGWDLREPLAAFPVPLKRGAAEVRVDFQAVFNLVFEQARYGMRLDYRQPLPPPKLSPGDLEWWEGRSPIC